MQPARSLNNTAGSTRMTLASITRGKQERPLRVIVHGVEGVGKSTFGADAPSPVFLCAEDGTAPGAGAAVGAATPSRAICAFRLLAN